MSENPPEQPEVEPVAAYSTEIVVRETQVVVPGTPGELVARLRRRLPELARHPAVLVSVSALAVVGARLAVGALARAVDSGRSEVTVTGYVVHSVHVVHHVVHHVAPAPLPPAAGD